MDNYEIKLNFMLRKQNKTCPGTGKKFKEKPDIQHRCHKSKWRKLKFPDFIDSVLNLILLDHTFHLSNASYMKIQDLKAEKYQNFLTRYKKVNIFVNYPTQANWYNTNLG